MSHSGGGGAEVITWVDVIRGAQESLLGSGDAQTLRIRRINLDGNLARTSADPPPKVETRSRQTQHRENAPSE